IRVGLAGELPLFRLGSAREDKKYGRRSGSSPSRAKDQKARQSVHSDTWFPTPPAELAKKTKNHAGAFIAIHGPNPPQPNWQIAVTVKSMFVDGDMMGAIHRSE